MYDLIIIGGGVAAFSAALYAGRFRLKTLVAAENLGGTLILTDDIGNYPGFKKTTGMELFDRIKDHAKDYEIEILERRAEKVEKHADCFEVFTKDKTLKTKTIIFATGTKLRKLNVPGEKEFAGRGVHYCALCDGVLYKDKIIGVAGGSDSAAKEALLLAEYGKKVYIIYRKEKIRAEPVNAERIEQNKKIEIINNTNITEIKGDTFVNGVMLDKPYKGSKELKLDALFVEVGHIPTSDLARSIGVRTNEKSEIVINRDSETNVRGVFACGDVVDSKFKQAITGAAEGVVAAHSAYQYVADQTTACDDDVDREDVAF